MVKKILESYGVRVELEGKPGNGKWAKARACR
jgi:hypothetical protein